MNELANEVINSSASSFSANDLWLMTIATWNTIKISATSIFFGSLLGIVFGWLLTTNKYFAMVLNVLLDVFRSVPLLIQLVLFKVYITEVLFIDMSFFWMGTIVLSTYTLALVANVVRGGIESVPAGYRRAARSLGMSYTKDLIHVVLPVGIRAAFPSWVGVALSVIKDSALLSVLGYVELLRQSEQIFGRTKEVLLVLAIAGAFYFIISYPLAKVSERIERRWAQ